MSNSLDSKPKQDKPNQPPAAGRDDRLANPDKEFGEGNYKATRDYNDATERFVKSGKVDAAAKAARPSSEEEAQELERAEQAGLSKAKNGKAASRGKGK